MPTYDTDSHRNLNKETIADDEIGRNEINIVMKLSYHYIQETMNVRLCGVLYKVDNKTKALLHLCVLFSVNGGYNPEIVMFNCTRYLHGFPDTPIKTKLCVEPSPNSLLARVSPPESERSLFCRAGISIDNGWPKRVPFANRAITFPSGDWATCNIIIIIITKLL